MKIKSLLLTCILVIGLVSLTHAQETIKKILERKELRVGMTGNQPPFAMKSRSGDIIGYEVDMAELLAYSMGVELKIVILPFDQLIPSLKNGEIDAIMSAMTITPERNLEVAFVGPYMVSGRSILTKSSVLARVQDAQEINEHVDEKLAVLGSSTSELFANTFLPDVATVKVGNYDEALAKLRNDEVAAVIADYPYCIITALKNQSEGFLALDAPLTVEPIGIALPQGDPLFINLIENYLKALELANIFVELEYKWLENPMWLLEVD